MVDPSVVRDHHAKSDYCYTRPRYREGRIEKAVKVYTVNDESRYLLVQNVPALGVTKDLLDQLALYGNIEEYQHLDDYPCEEHTDVYWIKYVDINDARMAKAKMDDQPFFSKQLHICYAPEYETVEETRQKLQERRKVIAKKTRGTHNGGTKDDKRNFIFNTSAPPATFLSTVTTTTTTNKRNPTPVIPSSSAAAYRDPCDPVSQSIATATIPSLPLPPSASQVAPFSVQYPSQQQSIMYGGTMAKPTVHVSSRTTATSTTVSASNTIPGSRTRTLSSSSSKKAGANVKPLSTQERMSMFMEHTVASSYKSTPKIVIRKDANFKSACNKIRWLNKGSEAATARTVTSSAGNNKGSTTADSSEEKVNDDNGSQFYSFHEKADPSLDESVNPPLKLPSVLLTGHRSVDASIQNVRSQMDKVWKNPTDSIATNTKETPTVTNVTEAKKPKRRRI